jgi:hypothetical protein
LNLSGLFALYLGLLLITTGLLKRNPPIWLACANLPMKLYFAIHMSRSSWVMFLADTALHFMTLTSAEIQNSCRMISMAPEHIAIEMELVRLVGSLERAFTQQGMCCGKCKQVRSDNVSRYCYCSRPYQLVLGNPN